MSAHASPGYFEPWGKDANLKYPSICSQNGLSKHPIGVRLAEKVIDFHQQILSPVDGPRSHFHPCSSAYMRQAMKKHGFTIGFFMGCDRLMRENSDDWIYRKIEVNGSLIKHDPVR